jgi:hypothetical protein
MGYVPKKTTNKEGEWMGLYMITIGKLTLAVITTFTVLHDVRHFKRLVSNYWLKY